MDPIVLHTDPRNPDAFLRCDSSGKVIYPFEELARLKALQFRARGENMDWFRCWFCDRWHLGHARGERRRLTKKEMQEAQAQLPKGGSEPGRTRSKGERRRNKRKREK